MPSRRHPPPPPRTAPRPLAVDPAAPLPAVFLRSPAHHPWIYRKRILRTDPGTRPGDLVAVYAETDGRPELLGYGLYNPKSEIAVRLIREGPALPDEAFWRELLARAIALRREFLRLDNVTNAYRVIHAEADGFPGLVVDRYGEALSAEAFSLGFFQRGPALLELLAPLCGTRHWLIQPGPQMLAHEGVLAEPLASSAMPPAIVVEEQGTRFRIRFADGHKTGFFCDQRDNRRALASYCNGRSLLDLCCYTGGFAIQAKRLGNATEVIGVDLDETALELARDNAALNQLRIRFVHADVFPYMRDAIRGGKQFEVVVLDPPKLIRSRAELEEGKRKLFDLNRLALQLVQPGGLLLSCSCSGLLAEEAFLKLLFAAARQLPVVPGESALDTPRRSVQLLARTGAAPDHPVSPFCPETEYLHAAWLRVG